MQQPPKVWIISLLILIIIIFGICKYLQSQQNKGHREHFSNPLDYPHMNIYNYIDPNSGDFNTTKPDLKLDPSLLESRSVLSLQSICDYVCSTTAPIYTRKKRALKRPGITEKIFYLIVKNTHREMLHELLGPNDLVMMEE